MIAPEFVLEARRLKIIDQTEADRLLHPSTLEPKPWRSMAEHLAYVIAGCASGAAAIESINVTIEEVDTGRILPPPTGVPS